MDWGTRQLIKFVRDIENMSVDDYNKFYSKHFESEVVLMKEMKYFKPKSWTWWASVLTLISGLITTYINKDDSGKEMVSMGLIGIGVRGAIK